MKYRPAWMQSACSHCKLSPSLLRRQIDIGRRVLYSNMCWHFRVLPRFNVTDVDSLLPVVSITNLECCSQQRAHDPILWDWLVNLTSFCSVVYRSCSNGKTLSVLWQVSVYFLRLYSYVRVYATCFFFFFLPERQKLVPEYTCIGNLWT